LEEKKEYVFEQKEKSILNFCVCIKCSTAAGPLPVHYAVYIIIPYINIELSLSKKEISLRLSYQKFNIYQVQCLWRKEASLYEK
jgi:hypothetical protein